jgi:omega-6 fatty acid desaturase (delta-12 desaturase)
MTSPEPDHASQLPTPTCQQAGACTSGKAAPADLSHWKSIVARYQKSSALRASVQLVNTLGSYVGVWVLLHLTLPVSWWLTVPLAVLAGGLLVRVFIIFHDCGHGSFFASRRANAFWGFVTGLLTMTPFSHWRGEHAIHHGTTGDLDRRGIGDIWTMTVTEYLAATRWKRLRYRVVRNPFVLFVVAPLVLLLVLLRFSRAGADRRERLSVWGMNVAVLGMLFGMSAIYGFWHYLLIQLIVLLVAGSAGVWLFYLQHQFEDAYWERGENWDYTAACMQGSSFYKLPRVLQWFSGNIGFHHIHHLCPRIPNYYLEECHRSDPRFAAVKPMTIWSSLRTLGLKLWDESAKKLVGWRRLREIRKAQKAA